MGCSLLQRPIVLQVHRRSGRRGIGQRKMTGGSTAVGFFQKERYPRIGEGFFVFFAIWYTSWAHPSFRTRRMSAAGGWPISRSPDQSDLFLLFIRQLKHTGNDIENIIPFAISSRRNKESNEKIGDQLSETKGGV